MNDIDQKYTPVVEQPRLLRLARISLLTVIASFHNSSGLANHAWISLSLVSFNASPPAIFTKCVSYSTVEI